MKKFLLSLLTLIIVSSIFFACSVPWDMGDNLDNLEEVVFMDSFEDSNGYDKTTLNFEDYTFISEIYKYGFANAEAETSGKYTDKSWYMDEGSKGSFTYNNDSRLLIMTVTSEYRLKTDAETSYEADYEWHIITDDDDNTVKTVSLNALLTQDGMKMTFVNSEEEDWISNQTITYVDGATETYQKTLSISGTEFTETLTMTNTEKNAAASEIGHYTETYTYDVNNFFLSGEETGDKEFSEVWKEGNAVTFMLERTKYTRLSYTGTTAPEIPTADETTGTAQTGDYGVDYAKIDLTTDTETYSFTHFEDCIVVTDDLAYSGRGLE